MHVHISKPSNNVNEMRYRPFISTRGTMDYAHRGWWGNTLGWQDIQCADTHYNAPPGGITIAQHMGVWAWWMNNGNGGWVWCSNGPEISHNQFAHQVYTEWWWWAFPCQDIADSAWFFTHGYYRGRMTVGTHERFLQTEWFYAGGP